jgi:hypothetical protein
MVDILPESEKNARLRNVAKVYQATQLHVSKDSDLLFHM